MTLSSLGSPVIGAHRTRVAAGSASHYRPLHTVENFFNPPGNWRRRAACLVRRRGTHRPPRPRHDTPRRDASRARRHPRARHAAPSDAPHRRRRRLDGLDESAPPESAAFKDGKPTKAAEAGRAEAQHPLDALQVVERGEQPAERKRDATSSVGASRRGSRRVSCSARPSPTSARRSRFANRCGGGERDRLRPPRPVDRRARRRRRRRRRVRGGEERANRAATGSCRPPSSTSSTRTRNVDALRTRRPGRSPSARRR